MQRLHEWAGTLGSQALRSYSLGMVANEVLPHNFGVLKNSLAHGRLPYRRSQRDNRSYFGTLDGNGAGDHATQAVSDEMDFASGCGGGICNHPIHNLRNQEIGATGIEADAGVVRTVSQPFEPGIHNDQVGISMKEPRDEDDG